MIQRCYVFIFVSIWGRTNEFIPKSNADVLLVDVDTYRCNPTQERCFDITCQHDVQKRFISKYLDQNCHISKHRDRIQII